MKTDENQKPLPLTTQIAMLARRPNVDDQGEWQWDWEEISLACLMVARDAARMARFTEEDWDVMMARLQADEAQTQTLSEPLNDDGTPVTIQQLLERGIYVLAPDAERVG